MTRNQYFILFTFFTYLLFGCVEKRTSTKELALEIKKNINSNSKILKMNGVSFVASGDSLQHKNVISLLNSNANYAAIMPFSFIKSLEHPKVIYDSERQWFGETKEGVKQYINLLHKNEIKILLKPQIWVWNGEFTGLVKMASEENWLELENTYRNFIIDFAKVAEEENVEIFCIGTELENFIVHRPEYWRSLIAEIRNVYKGKLTYAANWDEYKRVPFWDALDFIGVDAYFPVSESKTPTVEETKIGWEKWKGEMKIFSEKEKKKILFTEYGFRSVDFAGREPWVSDRAMKTVNLEAQANLLEATYQSVWKEDWFAGGFLWKWFIKHEKVGGEEDNQFTPQNKPAESVLKIYNSKSNKP